ncbi:zinc finger HIT domain-containing protein 2 [Eucyclogobius newberryi]|uniref:zinc finger HIT domain-containing protein 2 n=1 Tax=Eucyclogobius newberryi TaxID=166745 RepID=UPI003B5B5C4E
MNPITKRRLPSSLRSLLTDISPKEECTDLQPDPEIRDGIILPPRGAAVTPEELLPSPHDQSTVEGIDKSKSRAVCMLCSCKPSLYTCPRCNVPYCSLSCYKSPEHSVCSEDFYKESVLQELKEMGKTEEEGKKKMQEILLGLRNQAENTEGGMESLLKDEGVLSRESEHAPEDSNIDVEAIELLARLAELQEDDEENTEEIETILRSLQKLGTGDNGDALEDEDSQDENDEMDIAERLQELDIDELSEEQLWSLLNKDEKKKFVGLIKHGAFNGLVSLWKPWWEEHEESERVLIEVLQDEMDKKKKKTEAHKEEKESNTLVKQGKGKIKDSDYSQVSAQTGGVPPVSSKIPKLSCLCPNPSPLVGFSLVNAVFSYSFTLSFFNGDNASLLFELCDMVLALSESLNSNKIFNSVQEALDSGETLILGEGCLSKDDPYAPARAVEAVAHILTGRNREDSTGYCLSALSQLRSVLSQARAALSKEGDGGNKRKKYFMASKKCEFLQAWVVENEHNINILAIELWNEHSKRQKDIVSMTKAKAEVEQSWKKGRRRGNGKLVEEL